MDPLCMGCHAPNLPRLGSGGQEMAVEEVEEGPEVLWSSLAMC